MKVVRVESSTTLCATSGYIHIMGNRDVRNRWIRENPLFVGDTELGERIVTPVALLGDYPPRQFWMDAVTGSIYHKDGRCLTSSNLHLTNVRKEKGLDDRLRHIHTGDRS
jgi:hypothetical protein